MIMILKCPVCGAREERDIGPGDEQPYCKACFGPMMAVGAKAHEDYTRRSARNPKVDQPRKGD